MRWMLYAFCGYLWWAGGACTKEKSAELPPAYAGFTAYHIRQGAHYADESALVPFDKTQLNFLVLFDSSAVYTTTNPANQYDINKLYGFSDCGTQHHINSARFGWRWSDRSLRLFAYCYKDSIRTYVELDTVPIGKPIQCRLQISGGQYLFTLNGKTTLMARGCTDTSLPRYRLFPYFGGDEVAPHNIIIRIKEQ